MIEKRGPQCAQLTKGYCLVRFRPTGSNTKTHIWIPNFYPFRNGYPMYGSHLRMFATYAFDEEFPLHGSKGRTDTDPIIPVVHFSTDIHFTGDPIDKRTETDTLYQTLNGQD